MSLGNYLKGILIICWYYNQSFFRIKERVHVDNTMLIKMVVIIVVAILMMIVIIMMIQ